jgi:hypothetical protein
MIGKGAVGFFIEKLRAGIQSFKEAAGYGPGRSVGTVHHDPDRSFRLEIAEEIPDIFVENIILAPSPVSFGQRTHGLIAKRANRISGKGHSPGNNLQPVVLGRIVACGDHGSTSPLPAGKGVVESRCGEKTQTEDIQSRGADALGKSLIEFGRVKPVVVADDGLPGSFCEKPGAKSRPDLAVAPGLQFLSHKAANVIFTENVPRQFHPESLPGKSYSLTTETLT